MRDVGAEPTGHVRLGYARAPTARRSLDARLGSLAEAGASVRGGVKAAAAQYGENPGFGYAHGQASSGIARFGEHVTTARERYEGRSR